MIFTDSGGTEMNVSKELIGEARITPYLTVRDVAKAIRFYEKAFGFVLADEPWKDDEGNITHVTMAYKDACIFIRPESPITKSKAPATLGAESPVWLCMNCDYGVDDLFKQAVAAGSQIVDGPEDKHWGYRVFKVFDLDGHSWSFHQKLS